MTKLFELLEGRHVKPINPIHIFSFIDVANAVRYLRAGKHISKVVISDSPEPKISVPVGCHPSKNRSDIVQKLTLICNRSGAPRRLSTFATMPLISS